MIEIFYEVQGKWTSNYDSNVGSAKTTTGITASVTKRPIRTTKKKQELQLQQHRDQLE